MLRAIRRRLREIDRNSRRLNRGWADRVLGISFVASALIAPAIVFKLESLAVRRSSETVARLAVFTQVESGATAAVLVKDPTAAGKFPSMSVPLAEVTQLQERSWHGWPFVTRDRAEEPRFTAKLLPTCPPSREGEVIEAARIALETEPPHRLPKPAKAEERVHVGGWVFSIGAWWMLLTATTWIALLPIRAGREVHRAARNAVRQGRIDRCHCPNCGYDAKGSIQTGRCPECGGDLYERPVW